MRIWKNANDTMRVGAYEKDGKFYLVIEKRFQIFVATKGSRKVHREDDFSHFEKEFDNAQQANNYFKALRKNNPTLKEI